MLTQSSFSSDALSSMMNTATMIAPVVTGFVPGREVLTFTLGTEDEDADLYLRDMADGSGCRIEVGERLIAIIAGLSANDIDEGAIRFEFED